MDKPTPRPCIQDGYATCLVSMADLHEVQRKVSDNALYGVYQDWVHQNPGNNLDGGIKEDGKWQDR